jgi:hypothetical protein
MRTIIQVATHEDRVYAVCEDGTLWSMDTNIGKWSEMAGIPDPPPEQNATAQAAAQPAQPATHSTQHQAQHETPAHHQSHGHGKKE